MAVRDVIIIEDNDENGEIFHISDAQLQASSSSKQPLLLSKKRKRENKTLYSFCAICMDTKTTSQIFENNNVCGHLFYLDCIRQHVAVKIKENITKVKCPDPNFKGVIGPKVCRSIVPEQVLKRSENILCDSVIMESQKFYSLLRTVLRCWWVRRWGCCHAIRIPQLQPPILRAV
ncbi:putative transcription factor C2H2 family [Helianthus debilis subsp. tardiflorus]